MVNRIPFRKKIALDLFRKLKDNTTKIHQLKYIFWECTLRCNLNCKHCGSDCNKDASVKDMPVKDFISVMDQIKTQVNPNKTMIVFTGGEPLLRRDLEQCGMELYKRGYPWGTVTNGYLLNEKRVGSLINAGMRAITISLDGLEESHNWLRGLNDSFQKAYTGIQLIAREESIVSDVVTCVNQNNFHELNDIKQMLIDSGIKKWRLFTVFPIGRAKDSDDPLQLNPVQFRDLFEFIKTERQNPEIEISYGCEGFLGNYEKEVRDEFFFCRAGINIASILVDGSISACPNINHSFIQGNIYKDRFLDIWENKFSEMRNRDWTRKGDCKDCKSYKYCQGNGMHLYTEKDGDLMFCHLNKLTEN